MPGGVLRPIPASAAHLCIDMQRMFVEDTAWQTPWAEKVLPRIIPLCEHRPERNWFTRFIPAQRQGEGEGTWRAYWDHWPSMTIDALGTARLDLALPLQRFVPPGQLVDKRLYSPWTTTDLHSRLRAERIDTLVVTGAETDVCVLAAVLGAVDLGYRIIVVTDAVCSSSDETHDRLLTLYRDRYSLQVETAPSDEVLAAWA